MASNEATLEDVDLALDPLPGDALHRIMDLARERGPVVGTTFYGAPALLVTRHAELRSYFSMADEFPGGDFYRSGIEPVVGPTFISMDGEQHDLVRQLATPAFRSTAVRRFIDDEVKPLAHEVIDRFVSRGEADLVAELARVLPFWVISRKLGLPFGTEESQRALALQMLSYPSDPEGALAAASAVTEFLAPILEQRRRRPGEDVVSQLLVAGTGERRLSDEDVCSHVRLLYAVGATTTSDAMSSMIRFLVVEEGLRGCLAADPDRRSRFVDEVLRCEPPVSVLPRTAPAGGELAGVAIPPGSMVLCGIASANRDPRVFARPHVFDLDRTESDTLTFGFGSKFCPGSHLARHQLLSALEVVLDRLPGLRLVEAGEPTNAVLRRVESVVASWKPEG